MSEEARQQELEALQAVFAEHVQVLQQRPLTAAIAIPVSLAPPGCSGADEEKGDAQPRQLQHLPPVTMVATLPEQYPETAPPELQFSCGWMAPEMLERVAREARAVCEQNLGGEVLYLVMDHLMQFVEAQLQASPESVLHGAAESLQEYDKEAKRKAFEAQMQTCFICFTDALGSQCVLLTCGHSFCRNCMTTLAEGSVTEGGVERLVCPDTSCRKPIEATVLCTLLSDELYERWDRLTLSKAMATMNDTTYCPRCSTVVIKDSELMAQCTRCMYAFCPKCQDAYHPAKGCLDSADKLERLSRQLEEAKIRQRPADKIARLQADVQEVRSLRALRATTKPCPVCGSAISKISGCNKVICSMCNHAMCYKCGKCIDDILYGHFRTAGCGLFDQPELDDWNRRVRAQANVPAEYERMLDIIVLQPMMANELRVCPTCKQRNLRTARNNHIRCWSCKKSFCGNCNAKVRKTTDHFGIVCPQHS